MPLLSADLDPNICWYKDDVNISLEKRTRQTQDTVTTIFSKERKVKDSNNNYSSRGRNGTTSQTAATTIRPAVVAKYVPQNKLLTLHNNYLR